MSAGQAFGVSSVARVSPRVDPRLLTRSLVAPIREQDSIFSGTRLIEDVVDIKDAIENRSWLEGSLSALAFGADLVAAVIDPLGEAIAMGIAWVLDHIEPLKGWLNDLTGDSASVMAASETWGRISAQMKASAEEAAQQVSRYFEWQRGQMIDAYMRIQQDAVQTMEVSAQLASAMSTGLSFASMLVKIVHDLVRDAIADVISTIASMAFWEVVTVGIATPYVVTVVTSEVAKWTARLSANLTSLVRSFDNLAHLLSKAGAHLTDVTRRAGKAVNNAFEAGARHASAATDALKQTAQVGKTKVQRGINVVNALKQANPLDAWTFWKNNPEEFKTFMRRVMDPQYTTDVVQSGRKSATELLPEILSSPKMEELYRTLGVESWDMETFRSKAFKHADSPDLSDVDRRILFEIREHFEPVRPGDYMSKFVLNQKVNVFDNPQERLYGFMARSEDVAGMKPQEAFDSLAGNYFTAKFKEGATIERNPFDPDLPLYEVRFQADESLAAHLRTPYAREMPSAGPAPVDILKENWGHRDGPFTGTGFTASSTDKIAPEYKHLSAQEVEELSKTSEVPLGIDAPAPPLYQEIYDAATGRRVGIGVELPWKPGETMIIRVAR